MRLQGKWRPRRAQLEHEETQDDVASEGEPLE